LFKKEFPMSPFIQRFAMAAAVCAPLLSLSPVAAQAEAFTLSSPDLASGTIANEFVANDFGLCKR
jgi:hypothetical protein